MRRVGLYIRVSTEEQAKVDEGSIKNQTHGLRKYVEAENLKEDGKWGIVTDEYVDDGYSGKNLNRPELKRLLKDILHKKIDTVIMTEISRLSRSVKNWCDLREFFKEQDAIFIALRQKFDTSTAMGNAMLEFAIQFAQLERELTAERVKASKLQRASRGLWTGGVIPYGLEKTDKPGHLKVNLSQQIIGNEILDILLRKAGYLSKAVELITESGYRKADGESWDTKSLARWIRQPALIGQVEVNSKNKERDQSKLPQSEKYRLENAVWEPVVERKKWYEANALLDENYKKLKVEKWQHNEYFFSGILECEKGKKFIGGSGWGKSKEKYTHYRHQIKVECSCGIKTIPTHIVDKIILKQISKLVSQPKLLETLTQKANHEFKDQKVDFGKVVSDAKRRLDFLNKKIGKISDAILEATSDLEKQGWREQFANAQTSKRAIEDEIANLDLRRSSQDSGLISGDDLRESLELLFNNLDKLPVGTKQRLFSTILDKIVASKDNVKIFIKNPGFPIQLPPADFVNRRGKNLVYWEGMLPGRDLNPRHGG